MELSIECKLLTLSDYYSDMQKRLTNQKIKVAFSFDKTAPFSFSFFLFLQKKNYNLQTGTANAVY